MSNRNIQSIATSTSEQEQPHLVPCKYSPRFRYLVECNEHDYIQADDYLHLSITKFEIDAFLERRVSSEDFEFSNHIQSYIRDKGNNTQVFIVMMSYNGFPEDRYTKSFGVFSVLAEALAASEYHQAECFKDERFAKEWENTEDYHFYVEEQKIHSSFMPPRSKANY